jgi:hypothetical protein
MIECKICNKQIKLKSIGKHLIHYHNFSTEKESAVKQYYDIYLKNVNEGICIECNSP